MDDQLWWTAFGAIAQAAGSLATFAAVAVSLWVVLSERAIKATGSALIKLMIPGDGRPATYLVSISVTNCGLRPIRVNNLGWRSGWLNQRRLPMLGKSLGHRLAIQMDGAPPFTLNIPRTIEAAATQSFHIRVADLKRGNTGERQKEMFARQLPLLGNSPIHAIVFIDGREPLMIKVSPDLAEFLRTGEHPDTTAGDPKWHGPDERAA